MSEATHTLGPWTTFNETDIYPDDGDNTARRHIADCDVSNAPITTQDGSSTDLTYGECRANARLIAAAPDMLEALKAVLEEIDNTFPFDSLPGIKAAIKKAEGTS